MSYERAQVYLSSMVSYTDSTCFTGGEALLYHREVARLTTYARDLDLRVGLVTGAGWVRTEALARRRMGELAEAGLERMAISWDAYHEEFSLRERAVLLARVAVDAGIDVTIRTVRPANGSTSDYRAAFGDVPVKFETSRLARLGRAVTLPQEHFLDERSPIKGACDSVLSALVDYDGRVYACCGPSYFSTSHSPLVLGNADEEPLEQILERAVHDPVLEVISLLGPYGLYLLLKESDARDLYQERSSYSTICDLCLDLTNSMEMIAAIRAHITDTRAQALLTAARMLVGQETSEPEPALAVR
jgi:MoaA/NifB/PqqE/SkfB family radical SAM enzyme